MKKILSDTNVNTFAPLFGRVTLGGVMFAHGAQKLFGWFDGAGFNASMAFFTENVSLPWLLGVFIIVIEFFGSLSLVLGLATRFWALAMFILNVGIIKTTLWQNGFFMNWFGTQKGEGMEFSLLMIGLSLSLVFSGAGKLSIDSLIAERPRLFHGVTSIKAAALS